MWKNNLEIEGLPVNMGKIKVSVCGKGLDTIKTPDKHSCGVGRKE